MCQTTQKTHMTALDFFERDHRLLCHCWGYLRLAAGAPLADNWECLSQFYSPNKTKLLDTVPKHCEVVFRVF